MKGLRRAALIVLAVAVGWVAVEGWTARHRYRYMEPDGPIEIVRDSLGVPHVFAGSRRSLFFGQGYATAADRMFQMDWSRRQLLGRRAEVTGRKDIVSDFRMRALGIERVARDLYARLPESDRLAVDAYADGVNCWLGSHGLPRECGLLRYRPDPWRPWDCLVVWRGMALTLTDLTDDLDQEVSALPAPWRPDGGVPALAEGLRASGRHAESEDRLGSNGWAASGARTETGHPLLAGDPHLGLAVPGPLCRTALVDSTAAATGFAIPGVPGLVMGRTRTVAWTPTAFQGDAADVFVFETDRQKPRRYRAAVGWTSTRQERPLVWLRSKDPFALPVFWQPIEKTAWGPVVKRENSRILVLRWAGFEPLPGEGLVTVHTIDARTVADIGSLLSRLGLPDINIIAADARGSIAHFVGGRLPARVEHRGPRNGTDSTLAWRGSIPFESLPKVVNPPEAYVASANGPPPAGPIYLGHDWPLARQQRLDSLLSAARSLSIDVFMAWQKDHLVPGGLDEVRQRLGTIEGEALSDRGRRAARILAGWDGRAEIDSVAPSLYRAWQASGDGARGLETACLWLGRRLGPDPATWTWGRIHKAVLRHALADRDSSLSLGPFPRAGDRGTLDVGGYASFDTSSAVPALSLHGPAARILVDLSPGGRTWGVLLPGQSGDPDSPHARDQFRAWENGRPVEFTPPGVRPGGKVETERLTPRRR